MAEKIVMPKLGATMDEGTIDSWLVEVGETVEEGDPIVEIQTDKITIEVEAEVDGVLLKKMFDVGDTIPVQHVIGYIGEKGEELPEDEQGITLSSSKVDARNEEDLQKELTDKYQPVNNAIEETGSLRRTPYARKMAKENNVPLNKVNGTGPLGRIQVSDIEKYIKENKQKITRLAQKIAEDKEIDISTIQGTGAQRKIVKNDIIQNSKSSVESKVEKTIPFKGMRKVIANNISNSFYKAPHVTLFSDVDVTKVVELRKELLPIIEQTEGVRLSYNEIIVKATAVSLSKNPDVNISLVDDKEVVYHSDINIGVAVAVPNGLVVPVIRNADKKGLGQLTVDSKSVAKQAREGKLLPADMQGSTFTISNLGMYAVDGFTPIINQPNSAILGVGQIQEKPVVIDGEIEVRSIMTLSLSFDHRIIDGAPAAAFLTELKEILEKPYKLMI